jgi:hypothetical protein
LIRLRECLEKDQLKDALVLDFVLSRTQVNGDVHVAGVSPNVVPDGVVVRLREVTAILDTHTRHETVQVVVKTIVGARQEVTLVVNVSIGVQGGKSNDSTVEATRRDCLSQAREYTLHNRDAIEFVSMDGCRN